MPTIRQMIELESVQTL